MYMSVLNTQQIMDILPHRSPFLLIDTVEELQPGVKCVAKKNEIGRASCRERV